MTRREAKGSSVEEGKRRRTQRLKKCNPELIAIGSAKKNLKKETVTQEKQRNVKIKNI